MIIISNTFIQEWREQYDKETIQLVEDVLEVEQFTEKAKNKPAAVKGCVCSWCCYITVDPETRASENGVL